MSVDWDMSGGTMQSQTRFGGDEHDHEPPSIAAPSVEPFGDLSSGSRGDGWGRRLAGSPGDPHSPSQERLSGLAVSGRQSYLPLVRDPFVAAEGRRLSSPGSAVGLGEDLSRDFGDGRSGSASFYSGWDPPLLTAPGFPRANNEKSDGGGPAASEALVARLEAAMVQLNRLEQQRAMEDVTLEQAVVQVRAERNVERAGLHARFHGLANALTLTLEKSLETLAAREQAFMEQVAAKRARATEWSAACGALRVAAGELHASLLRPDTAARDTSLAAQQVGDLLRNIEGCLAGEGDGNSLPTANLVPRAGFPLERTMITVIPPETRASESGGGDGDGSSFSDGCNHAESKRRRDHRRHRDVLNDFGGNLAVASANPKFGTSPDGGGKRGGGEGGQAFEVGSSSTPTTSSAVGRRRRAFSSSHRSTLESQTQLSDPFLRLVRQEHGVSVRNGVDGISTVTPRRGREGRRSPDPSSGTSADASGQRRPADSHAGGDHRKRSARKSTASGMSSASSISSDGSSSSTCIVDPYGRGPSSVASGGTRRRSSLRRRPKGRPGKKSQRRIRYNARRSRGGVVPPRRREAIRRARHKASDNGNSGGDAGDDSRDRGLDGGDNPEAVIAALVRSYDELEQAYRNVNFELEMLRHAAAQPPSTFGSTKMASFQRGLAAATGGMISLDRGGGGGGAAATGGFGGGLGAALAAMGQLSSGQQEHHPYRYAPQPGAGNGGVGIAGGSRERRAGSDRRRSSGSGVVVPGLDLDSLEDNEIRRRLEEVTRLIHHRSRTDFRDVGRGGVGDPSDNGSYRNNQQDGGSGSSSQSTPRFVVALPNHEGLRQQAAYRVDSREASQRERETAGGGDHRGGRRVGRQRGTQRSQSRRRGLGRIDDASSGDGGLFAFAGGSDLLSRSGTAPTVSHGDCSSMGTSSGDDMNLPKDFRTASPQPIRYKVTSNGAGSRVRPPAPATSPPRERGRHWFSDTDMGPPLGGGVPRASPGRVGVVREHQHDRRGVGEGVDSGRAAGGDDGVRSEAVTPIVTPVSTPRIESDPSAAAELERLLRSFEAAGAGGGSPGTLFAPAGSSGGSRIDTAALEADEVSQLLRSIEGYGRSLLSAAAAASAAHGNGGSGDLAPGLGTDHGGSGDPLGDVNDFLDAIGGDAVGGSMTGRRRDLSGLHGLSTYSSSSSASSACRGRRADAAEGLSDGGGAQQLGSSQSIQGELRRLLMSLDQARDPGSSGLSSTEEFRSVVQRELMNFLQTLEHTDATVAAATAPPGGSGSVGMSDTETPTGDGSSLATTVGGESSPTTPKVPNLARAAPSASNTAGSVSPSHTAATIEDDGSHGFATST